MENDDDSSAASSSSASASGYYLPHVVKFSYRDFLQSGDKRMATCQKCGPRMW